MMLNNDDYDARKYKCKPWLGARGPTWVRGFKPAFENALKGEKDQFSSIHQFLNGTDFGGWVAGAPPHIAGAGALAAQNALSIQSRITRGDTFLFLLKNHILNEDITDAIDTQMAALVGVAPAAAPAGPGGAAAAGLLPTDWAMQLWNWIDVTYGRPQQTGLLISNQDDEWTKTKLTDVGIDRNTIRRFHGLLMRINRARQTPHQPIQAPP